MEDTQIVALYWERNESALTETQEKYGRYCHSIAYRILCSHEDAEECVNDTYQRAWQAIPPHRPGMLGTFLGKITRRLALDRYKAYTAEKRGGGQTELVLDELADCIPTKEANPADDVVLRDALNRFLYGLPADTARVFLRRYWYVNSVAEISEACGMSESKVKTLLFRTRNSLKQFLEKEGITI